MYIVILQTSDESLGISVSGGVRNLKGDSPIYVTNIHPSGCLGRTKQIKVGSLAQGVVCYSKLYFTYDKKKIYHIYIHIKNRKVEGL